MEIFVWLEVITYQVEWKFAIIKCGELFVVMIGMSGMLEWCADNLDYPHSVSIYHHYLICLSQVEGKRNVQ